MRSPNGEIYHLQAQYAASSQKEITDNEACTGHLSSLPPKSLPPRRGLRFALSFVMPILITVISLVVLWVLISQVRRLSPGREYGVPFAVEGIGGPVAINDTSSSCDLIPSDAGEFEKSFRIDLRGPLQLSFAQAKTIDVVWDFVIGQGGRLLLAWISYIVFMDGLARLMETSHVKYQLFVTIVFETSSVTSTWRALKAVFTGQGWRGRAFFGWFSFATIYVLGFSTLVSAATGYINPSTTHFLMKQDNVWIAADAPEFTHCLLLAQGSALGLTDNAIVYGPQAAQSPYYSPSKYPLYYNLTFPKRTLSDIGTMSNILVVQFTVHDKNYLFDERSDVVEEFFCYENEILPANFTSNPQCLARPYFVWGFSSLITYILLCLHLVWTLGMFLLWLDAKVYSELCRRGRRMHGSFRNVLDLAEAVREQLGDELCAYSDTELARQLEKSATGLRFYTSCDEDKGVAHIGISSARSDQKRFALCDNMLYGGRNRRRK